MTRVLCAIIFITMNDVAPHGDEIQHQWQRCTSYTCTSDTHPNHRSADNRDNGDTHCTPIVVARRARRHSHHVHLCLCHRYHWCSIGGCYTFTINAHMGIVICAYCSWIVDTLVRVSSSTATLVCACVCVVMVIVIAIVVVVVVVAITIAIININITVSGRIPVINDAALSPSPSQLTITHVPTPCATRCAALLRAVSITTHVHILAQVVVLGGGGGNDDDVIYMATVSITMAYTTHAVLLTTTTNGTHSTID